MASNTQDEILRSLIELRRRRLEIEDNWLSSQHSKIKNYYHLIKEEIESLCKKNYKPTPLAMRLTTTDQMVSAAITTATSFMPLFPTGVSTIAKQGRSAYQKFQTKDQAKAFEKLSGRNTEAAEVISLELAYGLTKHRAKEFSNTQDRSLLARAQRRFTHGFKSTAEIMVEEDIKALMRIVIVENILEDVDVSDTKAIVVRVLDALGISPDEQDSDAPPVPPPTGVDQASTPASPQHSVPPTSPAAPAPSSPIPQPTPSTTADPGQEADEWLLILYDLGKEEELYKRRQERLAEKSPAIQSYYDRILGLLGPLSTLCAGIDLDIQSHNKQSSAASIATAVINRLGDALGSVPFVQTVSGGLKDGLITLIHHLDYKNELEKLGNLRKLGRDKKQAAEIAFRLAYCLTVHRAQEFRDQQSSPSWLGKLYHRDATLPTQALEDGIALVRFVTQENILKDIEQRDTQGIIETILKRFGISGEPNEDEDLLKKEALRDALEKRRHAFARNVADVNTMKRRLAKVQEAIDEQGNTINDLQIGKADAGELQELRAQLNFASKALEALTWQLPQTACLETLEAVLQDIAQKYEVIALQQRRIDTVEALRPEESLANKGKPPVPVIPKRLVHTVIENMQTYYELIGHTIDEVKTRLAKGDSHAESRLNLNYVKVSIIGELRRTSMEIVKHCSDHYHFSKSGGVFHKALEDLQELSNRQSVPAEVSRTKRVVDHAWLSKRCNDLVDLSNKLEECEEDIRRKLSELTNMLSIYSELPYISDVLTEQCVWLRSTHDQCLNNKESLGSMFPRSLRDNPLRQIRQILDKPHRRELSEWVVAANMAYEELSRRLSMLRPLQRKLTDLMLTVAKIPAPDSNAVTTVMTKLDDIEKSSATLYYLLESLSLSDEETPLPRAESLNTIHQDLQKCADKLTWDLTDFFKDKVNIQDVDLSGLSVALSECKESLGKLLDASKEHQKTIDSCVIPANQIQEVQRFGSSRFTFICSLGEADTNEEPAAGEKRLGYEETKSI